VRAEVLIDPQMVRRGARMIDALIAAAPIEVKVSKRYTGTCEILMTYGTGHPVRRPWWLQHRASGGRCIGWDLGYWHHERGTMRATIDDDHPQRLIRPEPPERWDPQRIELRNDFRKDGHALIVGMGQKSLALHRLREGQWEAQAVAKAVAMGLRPLVRPKKVIGPRETIEEALKGAALVLCRHSNVAVDACIAGVPVICEDGAAHALYQHGPAPTAAQRLEFLRSLAWWNWQPAEAARAWEYLLSRL
jgi:hypothetical protein